MKKFSFYIFSCLIIALSLCLGVSFFQKEDVVVVEAASSPQTFDTAIKALNNGETAVVNNTLIFINFQGESNTLLVENSLYEAYPYEVIEDTYNNSEYCVKNYFETTSNGKLSLNTNILYNGTAGTPFTLNYTRDYFITGSGTTSTLQRAILDVIEDAFRVDAQNYDLDTNDDGFIDSVTFMLTSDPAEQNVAWGTPLWAHSSTISSSIYITDNSGSSLRFGKYNLATVEIEDYGDDGSIPQDPLVDSNGIKIAESSTYAHELSHVLGLPDYYIYDDYNNTLDDADEVPVGLWDLMAYNYYQMPQHSLAYNKLMMGYIEDNNVIEITENDTYELYPVSYWETNQLYDNDVYAYYIQGQGDYQDQYFYIEYRKNDGLFDSMLPTSGLVVYRVDTNVINTTYSGVATGNYMAPPYSIQIMRNEVSGYTTSDLNYFGQGYIKMYTANGGKNFYYYSNVTEKCLEAAVATGLDGDGLSKIGNKIGATPTYGTTINRCNGHDVELDWATGDITYQVYSGNNQGSISPSSISYVNTGITIEVLNITSDGKIQFQIDWDELPDASTEEDTQISSSAFEDINLYNKLLEILSGYKGTNVTTLYSQDFKNYNVLNLSNANITSLVGLEKLDLPNITIINLMKNGLDSQDVEYFNSIVQNFTKLQYVNFNLNNIQINSSNAIYNNTKYIFGFQNYKGEVNSVGYFFSTDSQTNILSYYFNDDSILKTSFGTSYVDIYNNASTPDYYEYNVAFTNSNLGQSFTIKFYIIDVQINHVNIEKNSAFTHGVVVKGIDESLISITTQQPVSTISVASNVSVVYVVTIKNQTSVSRTFRSTYSIIDTLAPVLASSLAQENQNLILGEELDVNLVSYTVEDNGRYETGYTLKYGELSTEDKNVVSYRFEKLVDGIWTAVTQVYSLKINEEFRVVFKAVDESGNVSNELIINYIIVPSSVLELSDFSSQALYNALLDIAGENSSLILYPEVFAGIDYIDISNLDLTSLKGLENFKFDSGTIIDASNNKLNSTISISSLIDADVTVFLLFNDIETQTQASNFVYGIQNLKTKYINERPSIGENIIINEDYSAYFNYSITKDVSNSFGMSMLSTDSAPFADYGTYKITFTNKQNPNITHSAKIQYGYISLRNDEYSQEAGLPFSRDDIIFQGIDNSDYYFKVIGAPTGNLSIGEFEVTYEIYDSATDEKVVSLSQSVEVLDTIAPSVTLIGRPEVYVFLGEEFLDQGVRASDSYDSNPSVTKTGEVNTNQIGTYYITYIATDSSGNASAEKTRVVNVIYYPIRGINVNLQTTLYTGESTTFEITPIVPEGKENYIDPNLEYIIYINDEQVDITNYSYTFQEAGTYKIEVKAQTTDSSGNTRTVSSDTYRVIVRDKTFIENYGAYLIGGMAIFIVVSIIVYFVVSRRRDKIM